MIILSSGINLTVETYHPGDVHRSLSVYPVSNSSEQSIVVSLCKFLGTHLNETLSKKGSGILDFLSL